jgi:hypothetical protein
MLPPNASEYYIVYCQVSIFSHSLALQEAKNKIRSFFYCPSIILARKKEEQRELEKVLTFCGLIGQQ